MLKHPFSRDFSVLEMYVGIICSCLPCLKPFVKHVFPKLFRRSTDPERNQMALGTRFMSAGNSFAWIRTRTIGGGSGRRNARARHRGDTETIDTVEITGMGLRVDDKANSSATTMASSTTLRSEKNQPSKVVPFGAAVGVETAAIAATAPVLPNAANMTAGLQDQNSSESRTNTAAPSTNGSEMARQRSVEDMV